jgi:hypothetical protein
MTVAMTMKKLIAQVSAHWLNPDLFSHTVKMGKDMRRWRNS